MQLSDDEMDEILISHCIEPITLRLDAYTEFIESRAELIISKIEAAIGKEVVRIKEQSAVYVNGDEED